MIRHCGIHTLDNDDGDDDETSVSVEKTVSMFNLIGPHLNYL